MRKTFAKTFGGLTRNYLKRQLFFGFAIAALFMTLGQLKPDGPGIWMSSMLAVNATLYLTPALYMKASSIS